MKINWRLGLVGLTILGMLVRFPDIAIPQVWDSSTEYAANDEYDSSFLGPLPFCVRKDVAAALASADGKLQPFICDSSGNLHVTTSGGGGGAVTNTGTFVVQEDGAALTALQLVDNIVIQIDDVVGATQSGVLLLGKHKENLSHLVTADGDANALTLDSLGQLHVNPEGHHSFDAFDAVGSWLILDDATENFTTTKKHALGSDALIFDKTDGSGTFAAVIDQTISSVDLGDVSPHDLIQTIVYIPDLTDVAYVLIRLGTSDSAYNEWRIPDSALTAATFETLIFTLGNVSHAGITGNGWDPSAITYIAVGVQFDGEDDALVGIIFDTLSYHTNQHTSAELNAEVSSNVSSAKIDLQKINGSVTDKNSGNKSNGSQRIVVATDDINLSAIKTATEAINTKLVTGTVIGDVNLGAVDNAVLDSIADGITAELPAGLLHANSPVTLIDTFSLFDGSGETQIATTNLGASKAYSIPGTGRLVHICVIVSLGTPFAENMSIIFFDADPSVTIEDAALTLAASQNITNIISLRGSDFRDNFATTKTNCQTIDEPYVAITHVVFASEGTTTYDDEDIEIRVLYRRKS